MSQTPQHLTVSEHKGVTVVQLLEQRVLEPGTIAEISSALREVADRLRRPLVLLDFTRVTRFSSAALGMVVELHQHLRNRNGHLCLANVSAQIAEVFRITRLDQVLNIQPTSAEAVAALQSLS
jgi:anti-sigma B factor antagonist